MLDRHCPSASSSLLKRSRTEANESRHDPSRSSERAATAVAGLATTSTTTAPPLDRIVVLNVGGRLVTTLASTLRAYPSRFMEWLDNDFKDLPRDAQDYPFIDRDYESFKHVLNYFRGYGLPVRSDELILLADDALFYDVAAMKRAIGMDPPPAWRFNPGPGVHEDGSTFTVANMLGLCGTEPLSVRQTHKIVFRIDKCELVEVGVVGLDEAREDQQIHHQKNSVCYCNTGELVRYWADAPLYTSGTSYKMQELITVRVQFVTGPASTSPATDDIAVEAVTRTGGGGSPSRHEADAVAVRERISPPNTTATPTEAEVNDASTMTFVRASELHDELRQRRRQRGELSIAAEDVPASALSAVITFSRENKTEFEVRWPAPVPPLQFAVSIQGTSSVTILDAVSMDEPTANFGAHDIVSNGGDEQQQQPQRQSTVRGEQELLLTQAMMNAPLVLEGTV